LVDIHADTYYNTDFAIKARYTNTIKLKETRSVYISKNKSIHTARA